MSQVKAFHLLHGIVLTTVLRNDQPTLRLVETDKKNAWAAYILNDSVIIYVKYCLTSRETQREAKTVWNFQFQGYELEKIKELRKFKPVNFTLVGGFQKIEDANKMQVCLMYPDEIDKCIDIYSGNIQTITMEVKPSESLRVYGAKNSTEKEKLVISRNRLNEWKIPGS